MRPLRTNSTLLYDEVSIPYRFNETTILDYLHKAGIFKFQFLIGSMRHHLADLEAEGLMFQFLIGSMRRKLKYHEVGQITLFN